MGEDGQPLTLAEEAQEFQGTRGFHLPAKRDPQGLERLLSRYQGWCPKRTLGTPLLFQPPGIMCVCLSLPPRAPALPDLHSLAFRPPRPSFPQIMVSFSFLAARSRSRSVTVTEAADFLWVRGQGLCWRGPVPGLPTSSWRVSLALPLLRDRVIKHSPCADALYTCSLHLHFKVSLCPFYRREN